ncbi:MAG: pitrilysin family protein, partial [Termitinemataceae bacterium]
MIQERTFDGGLRLIVETTAAADVAAVGVWYNRGSRDEQASEHGITHIIEHMLFKGTKNLSASQIARSFDVMGGLVNAFTERETMALHATVPLSGFPNAVSILSDIITQAAFDQEEFTKELIVIENELAAVMDDVEELASDAFSEYYWGEHPLAHPIGGNLSDIRQKSLDQVYLFYQNHIQALPDIISVAGGINIDSVYDAFAPFIDAVKKKKATHSTYLSSSLAFKNPPSVTVPRYHVLDSQYVQIFYALPGPERLSDERYHDIIIANAAFGDTMGSRLFQKLREDRPPDR